MEKKKKKATDTPQTYTFYSICFLLILIFYSIIIGISTGIILRKNVVANMFFTLGITDTPSKESEVRPLTKLLYTKMKAKIGDGRRWKKKIGKSAWVRVHFKNGEIFEGWPYYYSLSNKPGELYLSPACIIKCVENNDLDYNKGPGILIYENEIKYIDFIDQSDSPCSSKNDEYGKIYEKKKK